MDERPELFDDEEEESGARQPRKLTFIAVAAVLMLALIVRQLWGLQVVEGAQFRSFADENRLRISTVKAARGVIYDSAGELLARNVATFTVGIVPASLPDGREASERVFSELGKALSLSGEQVRDIYRKNGFDSQGALKTSVFTQVPIKTEVPREVAFAIEERNVELPGVTVVVEAQREYTDGPVFSHLLGYTGRITAEQYAVRKSDPRRNYEPNDVVGQTGLEQLYEEDLRGFPGEKLFEVDSSEREVSVIRPAEPQAGNNLWLSIDGELQRAVTDILASKVQEYGAVTAVVLNPNNGQVLAMADLPTYDNNLFAQGISQSDLDRILAEPYFPLLNKAINSAYPPGSVFKVVTAAAALQAGVVGSNTIIDCPGGLAVPGTWGGTTWLKCWDTHATEDMVAALADSCDTYFYNLAGGDPNDKFPGLGASRLADYARAFGLGSPTGIDLPDEVSGLVPDPEWKRANIKEPWYQGDTYIMGIGQGYLQVTPLQIASVLSSIANGGTLYRPQVVKEIKDENNGVVREFQPQVIRELPIESEHLKVVGEGMLANMSIGKTTNGVQYYGTAHDSNIEGIQMAGKTGTAESILNDKGEYLNHGWFGAYAPYENPEVCVVVFVENGKGPQHAAKLTAEIMSYYFKVPYQSGS